MRIMLCLLVALSASACIGSAPVCAGPGAAQTCNPDRTPGELNGESLSFVACDEAWIAACAPDEPVAAVGRADAMPNVCGDEGPSSGCPNGSDPYCVTIPCDGAFHYGTDHPDRPAD